MKFSHLHVHTTYSILDGMAKVEELIDQAKALGQEAIAITDHGSTSALFHAQEYGKSVGVKVILGSEFYIEREYDEGNGHIILLAKNQEGLANLFKMQEISYVKNFYKKPRINYNILSHHKEGLICLTACLASDWGQYIINYDERSAIKLTKKYKELFKEDFYLEIQPNQIPEQHMYNKSIIKLGDQLSIPVVATNDVHYVYESDHYPHEVLLAMQVKKKIDDEKRFRFDVDDFWLKSTDEMKSTFNGLNEKDVLNAMNTTERIVEGCNTEIKKDKYLPRFYNIPEGMTERKLLAKEVTKGAKEKRPSKEFMKDVQYELDVIDRNGYSGYFLIVADYVNSARQKGILVGDGRGSGAGSKIAYLTGITKINPDNYNLLFERFLSDGRSPDFDVDFSDQEFVFNDLTKKYGEENVARVIAFGTMTPKAVCRKVFSTFNHPITEINYVSKQIPDLCPSIKEAYDLSPQLIKLKEKYKKEFQIIERLEGTISHESQHAGGVIIYPDIGSNLPIKTKAEDRDKRIVGFDKYMLEDLGFYKFDILGLTTLPVLKNTLDSIQLIEGVTIDLYETNYDDPKVYDMLSKGDVSGVFQLANQAGKVMEQKPKNFNDLIAINALIRPGVGDWNEYIARRKGKEWNIHPHREKYMNETEGLMCYQEQFLLDAKTFAGWDIAYADKNIRKNKDIRNDLHLQELFITNSIDRGYALEDVEQVWHEIVECSAGGYNFNKSHAASYAMLSFQTAYLKCYYPIHFYSSLMTSEKTDTDGQGMIEQYIFEAKEKEIKILPPDINLSSDDFIPTKDGILYRITAIKDVGDSAIKGIEHIRPIQSFQDMLERRQTNKIKKNVITSLIKAGCFDFDNPDRSHLLWELEMSLRKPKQIKDGYEPEKLEYNDRIKAKWEREVLGVYLSSHPMEKYGFKPLDSFNDNDTALQGGEVYDLRVFKDKNKNEMCFAFLSTLYGNVKVVIFSNSWNEEIKEMMRIGNIVLVKGRRSGSDILLDKMEVLEEE